MLCRFLFTDVLLCTSLFFSLALYSNAKIMNGNVPKFVCVKFSVAPDRDRALGHVSVSSRSCFSLADAEQSRLEQVTRRIVITDTFLKSI